PRGAARESAREPRLVPPRPPRPRTRRDRRRPLSLGPVPLPRALSGPSRLNCRYPALYRQLIRDRSGPTGLTSLANEPHGLSAVLAHVLSGQPHLDPAGPLHASCPAQTLCSGHWKSGVCRARPVAVRSVVFSRGVGRPARVTASRRRVSCGESAPTRTASRAERRAEA